MKLSEVTIETVKEYIKLETEDTSEDIILNAILPACRQFIKSQTGLDDAQCDEKEDLTIVLLILSSDMYENRFYSSGGSRNNMSNPVVDSILGQYRMNLL